MQSICLGFKTTLRSTTPLPLPMSTTDNSYDPVEDEDVMQHQVRAKIASDAYYSSKTRANIVTDAMATVDRNLHVLLPSQGALEQTAQRFKKRK